MKHTEIRQAVIDGLESVIGNSAIFLMVVQLSLRKKIFLLWRFI
jgi:hypothetical protein